MSKSPHDRLIDAGWTFHKDEGFYTAPGKAKDDGTARRYNLDAALTAQRHADNAATEPTKPVRTASGEARNPRPADPRQQEPQ